MRVSPYDNSDRAYWKHTQTFRARRGPPDDGKPRSAVDSALGTTDDCGFSPFSDDTSTTRDTAFAKIRARVLGTQLAEIQLGDH